MEDAGLAGAGRNVAPQEDNGMAVTQGSSKVTRSRFGMTECVNFSSTDHYVPLQRAEPENKRVGVTAGRLSTGRTGHGRLPQGWTWRVVLSRGAQSNAPHPRLL